MEIHLLLYFVVQVFDLKRGEKDFSANLAKPLPATQKDGRLYIRKEKRELPFWLC